MIFHCLYRSLYRMFTAFKLYLIIKLLSYENSSFKFFFFHKSFRLANFLWSANNMTFLSLLNRWVIMMYSRAFSQSFSVTCVINISCWLTLANWSHSAATLVTVAVFRYFASLARLTLCQNNSLSVLMLRRIFDFHRALINCCLI
jgi:hypothetical protein